MPMRPAGALGREHAQEDRSEDSAHQMGTPEKRDVPIEMTKTMPGTVSQQYFWTRIRVYNTEVWINKLILGDSGFCLILLSSGCTHYMCIHTCACIRKLCAVVYLQMWVWVNTSSPNPMLTSQVVYSVHFPWSTRIRRF